VTISLSRAFHIVLASAAEENELFREGHQFVGHVPNNLGIDAALNGGQVMITHAESYLDTYFRLDRELPTDPAEIDGMVRDVAARTARAGVWVQPTLSVFRQINSQIADIDALSRATGDALHTRFRHT
jgi:hypothetical protein